MPQPRPAKKSNSTLIIVVVVLVALGGLVTLGGILVALGTAGTRKYMTQAKMAEARTALGMMAKDAVRTHADDGHLCPSAVRPVPATIEMVAAKKYQSSATEWQNDPGFACLKFEMSVPQYYQYDYKNSGSGFSSIAKGDLDGDHVASTLVVRGALQGGSLVVSPQIEETNPDE